MRGSPVVPVAVVLGVLTLLGPLVLLTGVILGADPLDGLGDRPGTNTPTQARLVLGGVVTTLFVGFPLFLVSLIALFRYRRADPRAMWLPAVALAGPLLLAIILVVSSVFG